MASPDLFKNAEDQFFRLKGRLATGHITRAQYEAALQKLIVRDVYGRFWTLSADTGKWHVHDGQNWIEATPPTASPAVPTTLPGVAAPSVAPAPRRRTRTPLLIILALVVVALLAAGVFALGMNPGSTPVALNASATSAPVALNASATSAPLATAPATPHATATGTSTPAQVSSHAPGVQVAVVSVASPPPIAARDFAALSASLAATIAALNQAELKFIRDLRASGNGSRPPGLALPRLQKGSTLTNQDLKDLAGKAMDVAIQADQLGELSTKQNQGSSQAARSADGYYAIARNAFSLVIDAQNVRAALQSGIIPGGQAIDLISQYGVQLWNTGVTDGTTKGNPFKAQTTSSVEAPGSLGPKAAAQVQAQSNANNASIWIAQPSSQSIRTLNVPAAQAPVSNPFDPQVLQALTTADGQNDGPAAQQVAAANLQLLGATTSSTDPSTPSRLQVLTNPVAVAGSDQIKTGTLPTYQSGKATIISRNQSGDENPFMQTFGLNGDQPPTDQGKTPVQDAPALVALNITDIVIESVNRRAPGSGSFEADVNFSFTVSWSTTVAAPQFKLNCNSHNEAAIAQPSGALVQEANGLLILYPGTLTVYCYANSPNGQSLGSTSVNVLVGDAADATTRAQQVETDSAQLNATLTAEALGTSNAQQTQAAGTAQVIATSNAVATEVYGTQTAEFKLTASAFETKQAQPPPATAIPTATPTFTPKVVDQVFHPGNEFAVTTKVVLARGRLYRFTFSGKVNLINPTESVTANQLPEHVNGVAVPASGIVVLEGTGSVATITCSRGEPDPNDPGGYSVVVEDLGPG
ncbi:MAG: hypothetical protein WCF84_01745 [Anaerolineae bacterium]